MTRLASLDAVPGSRSSGQDGQGQHVLPGQWVEAGQRLVQQQ
jgi:hypothetical protein